ncbi:MAG TPA: serine/threonine-protein kinase [Kofleriaceae bacterium]|nr:serine/threonine-protein kinase [Kofleriaceae bacterium]
MICPHCHAPLGIDARFCPACGKALVATETQAQDSSPLASALIGREIAGRFRILAKLGEGGMGAVYRGEQISLKRAVAVKVLKPELSQNPVLVRRFSAEAQAVAMLDHPNTVKVYDSGQDTDGSLFIAMEYIEGISLRDAMRAGAMPGPRAFAIAVQVAASLADAHAQSIVHRDLKPDNVMLQDKGRHRDIVRVLDFGIAKLRDDSRATQAAMTQAGDMLGTPQYMSPEQIRGDQIDGRTDLYALGCMLYEMVTGRLPFEGTSVLAILTKHLTDTVVPPSQRRPDLGLPRIIDQIVMTALAKEPAARPATMERFGELLQNALAVIDPNRSAMLPMSAATPMPMPVAQMPMPIPMPIAPVPIPPTQRANRAPMAAAPAKPRNWIPWFVLLGLLGIGGAGAGVYLGTHQEHADSNRMGDTTMPAPGASDPWDHDDALTPFILLRPGTALDLPSSFRNISPLPTLAYSDPARELVVMLGPVVPGTNDPDQIASKLMEANASMKLSFERRGELTSLGRARTTLTFTGVVNNIKIYEVAILYIQPPQFRAGLAVWGPAREQAAIDAIVSSLAFDGVHMP